MLHSMTGFGAASGSCEGVEYTVEVRSVNNRYCKPNIKLPEAWASAEMDIEKTLRQRISRGSVTLTVRMRLAESRAAYEVNTSALSRYLDQVRELETDANPTMRIDLGALMQLPGVIEPPSLDDLRQQTRDGLMELIGEAIGYMMDMRRQEGQSLAAELRRLCNDLLDSVTAAEQRAPDVTEDYRQRLAERVSDLLSSGSMDLDAASLAREVAIFAERSDITEETARLRTHVEHFLATLDADVPSGRKLDFLAQEMLREANTIGSKANDPQISAIAVDMKTQIDRVKEQVQNVE